MLINTYQENNYNLSGNGLWLPKKERRPIAIDLFCGCGGFSLGFMQSGFEIVAAIDWDPTAMITYTVNLGSHPINMHFIEPSDKERMEKELQRQMGLNNKNQSITRAILSGSGWISNFPEFPPVRNVWIGDIRKLKGQDILNTLGLKQGEVDCICGGPPCQGFSTAGKQNVMDPRNSLVFEFARLILEIKPKTMIMENVPGILKMVTPAGFPVVDELCRVLEDGGFGTMEALKKSILATAGCGAALKSKSTKKQCTMDEVEEEGEQISLF